MGKNSKEPRIALVTGTYGIKEKGVDGVGRFTQGFHEWSLGNGHRMNVFSSGDHLEEYPHVHQVRSLLLRIPGFERVNLHYPLEGARDDMCREIKKTGPDIVHVSTPDMLGLQGATVARESQLPLSATYHTDIPMYARVVAHAGMEGVSGNGEFHRIAALVLSNVTAFLGGLRLQMSDEQRSAIMTMLASNQEELFSLFSRRSTDAVSTLVELAVREYMWFFYHQCDLVLARSGVYREKLTRELNLDPDRVKTLQAGVDTTLFSPQCKREDRKILKRYNIPRDAFVVGYVGRVSKEKNIDFLAEVWRQFQSMSQANHAVLVVVGDGELKAFQQCAGDRVITTGPVYDQNDLAALYRAMDVLAFPSTNETLGQVTLEAQASGTPPLVSDKGAACENVRHNETGLVLPVDDPALWAQSIAELVDRPERLAKMGTSARTHMEGRTIEASYQHFWYLHQQLFEEHREKGNLPFGGVLPIVVSQTPQDDASCPVIRTHHTTHVGDIHCGHGQPSRRKEGAMRLIAERAKDRGAVIFNHGDTLDTGANQKRMQKELQMILKVLQECGMSFKKCMLGNHDFEYLLKGVMEKLLGHRVEPSLITCTMNNLLLTHGHVSELALLPSILEAHRGSRDAIMQALSIKALQKPLEDMAVMYDLIGYGEKVLQRVGIHGFNEFWRNIFPIRKRVARMLVDAIEGNGLPTEHMNAMMHMLGSEHREMMLAELALATDCQGFVFGHTHDPVLTVLELRGNQVLGGNVGCFRRKGTPITWIEACRQKRGRETEIVMELFGYEARKGWKGDRDVLIDRRSVPAIQRRKTS